ncbi:MAG: response regulator [Leptolyngbya sp. Prado105]|jgi:DNA-binding response OmpR family regulator|nr:response regulator [Leptolyngbya sp. Prado105]
MKILLVEDDDVFVKVLVRALKAQNYILDVVKDGEMGWTYGSTYEYDLIVLDVVLPKLDGISLCKRFRAEGFVTPILLLTSQDSNTTKVQGLDAGADDYVVKPFDHAELIARVRALLRRGSANPFPLLTCGDLMLNPSTYDVSYQGRPLTLTRKEYELLELMMRDSQHVFSTEELLDHLWSSEEFPSEATVRSHIRRVRQKLVAMGASPDFIATLHGRGYYLKASETETLPIAQETLTESHLEQDSADAQQQYLDFLNTTWVTTKSSSLDQVALILQAVEDLQADRLSHCDQVQAQHIAHKLVGTLSIFGLNKAVHLSRQLEYWLGGQASLQPNQAPLIQSLVLALQQDIQATMQIEASQIPHGHSAILLSIGAELEFNQALGEVAASRGIQLEVLPLLEKEEMFSAIEAIASTTGHAPNVILFQVPPNESPEKQWFSQVLQAFTQRHPDQLIIVIGDRTEFCNRLEVVRLGGRCFLDRTTPPDQIIATVVNSLKSSHDATKIMIVDDDDHWLRTLPTLLKPWGFRVTTLADPQQFWAVLQAITPDVLILDINMPQINGFELCQILRSDPKWQRLPVLFLSVLTDAASQHQAFTVGADDYLCKPLMGSELANRILNRLQRIRTWVS